MHHQSRGFAICRAGLCLAILTGFSIPSSVTADEKTVDAAAYKVECPDGTAADSSAAGTGFGLEQQQKNYLIFNHATGIIEWPVPAQLEARDGETFAILFACTAPEAFDYKIEAIAADKVQGTTFSSGTESVVVDELVNAASITWRHQEEFPLYRVSVTKRKPIQATSVAALEQRLDEEGKAAFEEFLLRPGEPTEDEFRDFASEYGVPEDLVEEAASARDRPSRSYELHSYTFPVWVRTVGWQLSYSSGFGFSGLESPKFYLETVEIEGEDSAATGMEDSEPAEMKVVRRDRDAEDDFRPDLMALANLRFPTDLGQRGLGWLQNFGLSFGVGIGQDSEPRYYFGPSINLGDHFVLTGGVAGGKVETLPAGQRLDEPAINGDSTLTNLPKHFETEWFAGIAFRFRPAEKEFLGALSGVQKVEDAKPADGEAQAKAGKAETTPKTLESAKTEPAAAEPASTGRWRFGSCEPLERAGGGSLPPGPELSGLAIAGSDLVAPFEESNRLALISPAGEVRVVTWGSKPDVEIEGIAHHEGRYYLVEECSLQVHRVDLASPASTDTLAIDKGFGVQTVPEGRGCQMGLEGIAIDSDRGTVYMLDETDLDSKGGRVATIHVGTISSKSIIPSEPNPHHHVSLAEGWRYTDIVFHEGAEGPELLALATKRGGYRVMSVPLSEEDPGAPTGGTKLVLDLTQEMAQGTKRSGCNNPNLEGITVGPGGDILIVNDARQGEGTVLVRLIPVP